jgi:hypothetical protein
MLFYLFLLTGMTIYAVLAILLMVLAFINILGQEMGANQALHIQFQIVAKIEGCYPFVR